MIYALIWIAGAFVCYGMLIGRGFKGDWTDIFASLLMWPLLILSFIGNRIGKALK